MNPAEAPSEDIVWCPGCEFEAPVEEIPLGAATFGTCPECQRDLHTIPAEATEEYRELLRRF